MLRNFVRLNSLVRPQVLRKGTWIRPMSSHSTESAEDFNQRYLNYFNRKDIDGWEIRKGINDLCGMDLIPEPQIISAVLQACRRNNDYSLCIRFLEAVKDRCGNKVDEIYPYLIKEIKPTLDQLGIETPEELGYDKPELALADE